jgi:cytochrome c biogenesis factor
MPFENRWFAPDKRTYNMPTYQSESSCKLQPDLEQTLMHPCNLQFWIMKLQKAGNYKQNNEVPIKMSDSEKTQYNNDWRTYQERNAPLTKHRGQALPLILGQCTKLLQDRMKQDTNWNMASTSYDPLIKKQC